VIQFPYFDHFVTSVITSNNASVVPESAFKQ
jgi:hypothetical protein